MASNATAATWVAPFDAARVQYRRVLDWRPSKANLDVGVGGVLVGALLIGVWLRWAVLSGPLGYLDYDEAAAGIQARDFFSNPAVFFPGQSYGGTLEVLVTATFFQITSNAFVLKLVPIVLHGAATVVAWRAAIRLVPSVPGRLVVLVLMWVGPAFGIWESTKGRGFYGASILLSSVAALLVMRTVERPTPGRFAAFGLAAGVAVWTTPLLVLVFVPCGLWLAIRLRREWRAMTWAFAGALFGAAPSLVWNQFNGWTTLDGPTQTSATSGELLGNALGKVPTLIGLGTPWDPDRVMVPGAAVLTGVLLAVVLVVATLRTRQTAAGLLVTVLVGYAALYGSVVPLGALNPDLRYLYPTMPFIALAFGSLIPDARRRWGAAVLLGTFAWAAAMTSSWGIAGMERAAPTDAPFLASPGIPAVTDFLASRGIDIATTDVAGTQITFESGGAIQASSFAVPRFDALQETMFIEQPTTYVLESGRFGNDAELERRARSDGFRYEEHRFGVWVVYVLDRYVPPWELGLNVFGGQLTREIARQPVPGS